jgi:hypothetical protein
MDALLRIRTKDGNEILKSKIDDVVSKKKKQPKLPKAPKAPKVPKGVSVAKKDGEFAKFTPMQTPPVSAPPVPWDDEDVDELASAVDLSDDGKFETEDDIFTKQDQEWHELMKEADTLNNDDASSEVPEDDTSSEANFNDDRSDVSNIDSELEDGDVFYSYTAKESKAIPKATKIYSGIPIDFDDSDW